MTDVLVITRLSSFVPRLIIIAFCCVMMFAFGWIGRVIRNYSAGVKVCYGACLWLYIAAVIMAAWTL